MESSPQFNISTVGQISQTVQATNRFHLSYSFPTVELYLHSHNTSSWFDSYSYFYILKRNCHAADLSDIDSDTVAGIERSLTKIARTNSQT
jgi:hypothetical protein